MQAKDMVPAGTLANSYGTKAVCYGGPGSGKTPLINTAPRPMLLACEPGLRSMVNSTVPTYEAYTPAKVDEFFLWLRSSHEVKNYDTIGIDSASQIAEVILYDELKNKKTDKRALFGNMGSRVMEHMNFLFFMKYKHIYVICKQEISTETVKRPKFPGQYLHTEVPHLFDLVMHLDNYMVPEAGGMVKALRCQPSFDTMCRDRSGKLAEFEQPNLTNVFNKAMK